MRWIPQQRLLTATAGTNVAGTGLARTNTAGQFDNTARAFAAGEPVVIMQMQGKVKADTTNTCS
ncbi:MAG: hypothetical protein ABIQ21_06635 [Chryseolinea sp.]